MVSPVRTLEHRRIALQALGTIFLATGLFLKGTFLLVQAFGTDWLVFVGAVTMGVPLAGLAVIGWRKAQRKVGIFWMLLFVIVPLWIVEHPLDRALGTIVRNAKQQTYAGLSDYLRHPGDTSAIWGKRKYWVRGVVNTRLQVPDGGRVLVEIYGSALELKVGKQSCQPNSEKEQECRFQTGGELVLDSKGKQSQAYLTIVGPWL